MRRLPPIGAVALLLLLTLSFAWFVSASTMAADSTAPAASAAEATVPPPHGLTAGRAAGDGARSSPEGSLGWFSRAIFWVQMQQATFNHQLAGNVSQLSRGFTLAAAMALTIGSFLYGIFHAVGPGHGKAIISAYVLANERLARRGVAMAFLASFFQAVTAIVLVGILALIFNATGLQMQLLSNRLESISTFVITLFGAWLLWQQLSRSWFARQLAVDHHAHDHSHDHAGHDHGSHDHDEGSHLHAHMPTPDQLDGKLSWRKAVWMAAAVGLRPCSGAVIMLVFALSIGVFWIGVISTFLMALGPAITVSVLAALTVGSRSFAVRMTGGVGGAWVERAAGIGTAALVFGLGLLFFVASLTPHPFQ